MSKDALTMRGPVHGTKDARRVAVGSGVGAVIETYDFIGFGTAAALYFGTAFFPERDPVTGTLASFATLGVGFAARPLGGIIGGHLGDKVGRKPVLVASLILMGLATFAIGLLPTYAAGGAPGPGTARLRPHRPGPGLRRGMGRRHPDELRARTLEGQGQVHRHRPGRLPGGPAAGQPGLPVQRQPRRRTGLARPVPGQHRAGGGRPDHPLQGPGVPGLRRGQGQRCHREVPHRRGHQDRLAQHRPGHRPPHRRDRRLRRVHHLHDFLPQQPAPGGQDPDPRRPLHRLRHRHLRHPGLGRADRPDWPPSALRLVHRLRGPLRHPDVPAGQHRNVHRHHRHHRHLLRGLPELARRRPGRLVPGALPGQDPLLRRQPGLPDLGHGLRLHPFHHHPAVRQLRLDGPGAALQRLRA